MQLARCGSIELDAARRADCTMRPARQWAARNFDGATRGYLFTDSIAHPTMMLPHQAMGSAFHRHARPIFGVMAQLARCGSIELDAARRADCTRRPARQWVPRNFDGATWGYLFSTPISPPTVMLPHQAMRSAFHRHARPIFGVMAQLARCGSIELDAARRADCTLRPARQWVPRNFDGATWGYLFQSPISHPTVMLPHQAMGSAFHRHAHPIFGVMAQLARCGSIELDAARRVDCTLRPARQWVPRNFDGATWGYLFPDSIAHPTMMLPHQAMGSTFHRHARPIFGVMAQLARCGSIELDAARRADCTLRPARRWAARGFDGEMSILFQSPIPHPTVMLPHQAMRSAFHRHARPIFGVMAQLARCGSIELDAARRADWTLRPARRWAGRNLTVRRGDIYFQAPLRIEP